MVADALSRAPVVKKLVAIEDQDTECYAENCPADGTSSDWVQCDGCERWFHRQCVNITYKKAKGIAQFYCPDCKMELLPTADEDEDLVENQPQHFPLQSIPEYAEFRQEQREDIRLSPIIGYLERDVTVQKNFSEDIIRLSQSFFMKEDILVCEKFGNVVTVVPKSLRRVVIRNYHDRPTAGHMGHKKTLNRVIQHYWWKGISGDVRDFVQCCKICQFAKPVYKRPQGLMETIESSRVWEVVSIDFVGPLPASTEGYQYCLTICDHFSKFLQVYRLKHTTAKTLCAVMTHVFCLFGAPDKISSDNGPSLTARAFESLLKDWGIKHGLSTSYHPQSNFVERTHRNLKAMLCSFAHDNHTQWSVHIDEFMYSMNSVKHDTTKFSPSSIFLNRTIAGPGDRAVLSVPCGEVPWSVADVKHNLRNVAMSNKTAYDVHRTEVKFEPGQLVLVKSHPLSNSSRNFTAKLAYRWKGPFQIVERMSPLTYLVADPGVNNKNKKMVVHVEQIKKYFV